MKKNVLAIGAHFDDIELGAGGSVAKHVLQEDNVIMVVVTHSSYDNWDGTPIRTKDVALTEGTNAASILGVKNLICLNYETKEVKYGTKLIEDLNRIIDENNIDTVYTHWSGDVHQDHSAIAKATLNAARHVNNVFMYRSNWYASTQQFDGRVYNDISDYMDTKISSVKAHVNEYKKFGEGWIQFFVNQNKNSGQEIGVSYAECFQAIKQVI